jgi:hypothetical protein
MKDLDVMFGLVWAGEIYIIVAFFFLAIASWQNLSYGLVFILTGIFTTMICPLLYIFKRYPEFKVAVNFSIILLVISILLFIL